MNYTDSYCISDTEFGAALATPGNSQPFNRHADWGPCVFDTRHNFNMTLTATSKVHGASVWTNRLLSNWQAAPALPRFERTAAGDDGRQGQLAYGAEQRPAGSDLVGCLPRQPGLFVRALRPMAESSGVSGQRARHVRQSGTECAARTGHCQPRRSGQQDAQVHGAVLPAGSRGGVQYSQSHELRRSDFAGGPTEFHDDEYDV